MNLKLTRDEVRDRQVNQISIVGKPNPWWAWTTGSDCMGAQAYLLGIRPNKADRTPHLISIAAFTAYYGWDKPDIADLKAGDLVAENWAGTGGGQAAEHIEYVYSVDHDAKTITTCSANTGPHPGQDNPNGFWRKTRPLDQHFLHGIRPPYADAPDTSPYGATAPTALAKKNVKLVAAFLNEKIGTPATSTMSVKDGKPGHKYWTLVQTWGRKNGLYGSSYKIDGIVGPRTRQVEAIILKRAKAAAAK